MARERTRIAVPVSGNSHGPALESPPSWHGGPPAFPPSLHEAPPASPSVTPFAAIARHKLLVLLCAAGLGAIGAALGSARKGTYTAAATLQVGRVNPNSPGFYGFVQSASDLATAFSRAITAAPVLRAVRAHTGLGPKAAAARLSAEPIPSSPAFRVVASGPTAAAAVRLAIVTSKALIAYEARANAYSPDTARLLRRYRTASLRLAQATATASKAAHTYATAPSTASREGLENAQAQKAAASLQAEALAGSYRLSAQSTTAGLISMLAGAVTASSDRLAKIELLGLIGLIGGLAIGCTIAVLREQRPGRRGGGEPTLRASRVA